MGKALADQVVVVMGAASGIGRATALLLASRGARVVVAARSRDGLASLVRVIEAQGGRATAAVADVTHQDQQEAVAELALREYGRLDTWAHVAGVGLFSPFKQITPEEFRRVIDVNLLGPVSGVRAALPRFGSDGGALIVVTSGLARRAVPLQSAYVAAKHGLDGFLEALRLELRHDRVPVRVTSILPSSINTPLFQVGRSHLPRAPRGIGPMYHPQDVAAAIAYACEHDVRDLVVGGAGQALLLAQRVSPRLCDALLERFGFETQMTDEPRPLNTPDNLYQPVPSFDQVEGQLSDLARPSAAAWLRTHPVVAAGALAFLGAATAWRARR